MSTEELLAGLDDEEQAQGYLKAGLLGFQKSGKTYTSILLACAIRRHFKLDGHIAMFDTENGSLYVKRIVEQLTGKKLLARRSRSFDEMMKWGQQCIGAGVAVAVVDSVTHPWRELCDSYLEQKNKARAKAGRYQQSRLEFQDWMPLKSRWREWADFYLNSPLHLIISGRAGLVYEFQENDEGKKELRTTGTKMLSETEFGYEPRLLVELERQKRDTRFVEEKQDKEIRVLRAATVIGDCFGCIDGHTVEFIDQGDAEKNMEAVWHFFEPHISGLVPGAHATVDTDTQTPFGFDPEGEEFERARKQERAVVLDEIQTVLVQRYPAATGKDKQAKVTLVEEAFGTTSWERVKSEPTDRLREGLAKIRVALGKAGPDTLDEVAKTRQYIRDAYIGMNSERQAALLKNCSLKAIEEINGIVKLDDLRSIVEATKSG